MAAGRRGSFGNMEPENSRRRENIFGRRRDSASHYNARRRDSGGKYGENRAKNVTNGFHDYQHNHGQYQPHHHHQNPPKSGLLTDTEQKRVESSGQKVVDQKRVESSCQSADREPGELPSLSGSEELDMHNLKEEENNPGVNDDILSPRKKRKFSPIVWDRDVVRTSDADTICKREQTLVNSGELEDQAVGSEELVSGPDGLATEAEVGVEFDGHVDTIEPMHWEDEDDVPKTMSISSSRWADVDYESIDDGAKDVVLPKKQSASPSNLQSKSLQKKTLSPEPGEVVAADSSGGRVSNSSQSEEDQELSSHGMEEDHMEVDDLENDENNTEHMSFTESEDEDSRSRTPESLKPQHRCINMLQGCRSVDEFERLNKINEGTYGVVYRARDKKTGEIVALKKVKMEKEREGFPLTSLREINILLSFHHPSIVDVKEVVVGSSLDSIFMVMEYMEHDLKAVMEVMKRPFSQSDVKCLMLQLLQGVKYLHDNWVLHRDLKTSNLLLNNQGELKICDFGLSRQYGSPLKPYTQLVVTLWYRAPELLLGTKDYSTAIDMWSVGCIMAELLAKEPLFNGKTEFDQLDKIFKTLGTPNEKVWPGYSKLPGVRVNFVKQPYNQLIKKFSPTSFSGQPTLSKAGFDLLNRLLTYDPDKRITADAALNHPWFDEMPLPKSKDFFPTFPARHEQERSVRRGVKSPDPLEEQRLRELQGESCCGYEVYAVDGSLTYDELQHSQMAVLLAVFPPLSKSTLIAGISVSLTVTRSSLLSTSQGLGYRLL